MFLFAGHPYSRCDYFNAFIRWSLLSENQTFEVVDASEALTVEALKHHSGSSAQYGNPCAWISLNASAAGRATIVATFSSESDSYFETFNEPIFLKATSKVSAYYPLLVLQAGNGNQFGGYWVDLSRLQNGIQNMGNNSPKELYLVPGSIRLNLVILIDLNVYSHHFALLNTSLEKLTIRCANFCPWF